MREDDDIPNHPLHIQHQMRRLETSLLTVYSTRFSLLSFRLFFAHGEGRKVIFSAKLRKIRKVKYHRLRKL